MNFDFGHFPFFSLCHSSLCVLANTNINNLVAILSVFQTAYLPMIALSEQAVAVSIRIPAPQSRQSARLSLKSSELALPTLTHSHLRERERGSQYGRRDGHSGTLSISLLLHVFAK
jgi:hypothetical protein